MQKVGIVTFVQASNYGAVLQAFALQRILQELGYDSWLINYNCPYIRESYIPRLRGKLSTKNIKNFFNGLLLFLYEKMKNKSIKKFVKRELRLTTSYKDAKQLFELNDEYDFFISGSDQVFNDTCSNLDTVFFLSFVNDNRKKYTYAASFGFDSIPVAYKSLYRALLKDYKILSLRETLSPQLRIDLHQNEIKKHPDPTLLLTESFWVKHFGLIRKKRKKPFIFVYYVHTYKNLVKAARILQKKTGFQIVMLNFDLKNFVKGFFGMNEKSVFGADPVAFLSNIYQARIVLTNSFHATLFSTLFHIPFLTEVETDRGLNTRTMDFLQTFSLQDRVMDLENLEKVHNLINWIEIDEKMNIERENAISYLSEFS